MRATDLARLEWEIRHSGIRPIDLLAMALGYGLLLTVVLAIVVSLVDWMQGRPHEVLPQIVALLEWIDGGVR